MPPEAPPSPPPKRSCLQTCLTLSVVVLVLVGSAAWYLVSPRRDLEKSLNVDWLPWSLHNADVSVDAEQDYVVRGYFEIAPQDLEKILAARIYEKDPAINSAAPDPQTHGHTATVGYTWFSADGQTSCWILTDESKQWATFLYSWRQSK
jgi:hypothetical protein